MNAKELKSTKLYKEYSLEIPYEEIDTEVDNKINQILPTVNLPGFRKGKAPLNIVKKKYEDNVLNEVIQKVIEIKIIIYLHLSLEMNMNITSSIKTTQLA